MQRWRKIIVRALLYTLTVMALVALGGWAYLQLDPPDVCDAAPGLESSGGAWDTLPDMPTARSELAAAYLDGFIYVIGGLTLTGAVETFERYDIATQTWTALPPPPTGALHHTSLAALDDRLVLTGGYLGDGYTPSDGVYAYDPAAETWTALAALPAPVGAHTAQTVDGRLHVVGGVPDGTTHVVYDPEADTWTVAAPMPTPREHLGSGVLNDGRLYVAGGRWPENVAAFEAYDPADDTWAVLPDVPTARGGVAAATAADVLLLAGGEEFDPACTFRRAELYRLTTDVWTQAPDLDPPRHGLAVVGDGESIYVIGGATRAGGGTYASALALIQRYTPQPTR